MSHASGHGESLSIFRPFKRHNWVLLIGGICYMITGITYIAATPTANRKVALQVAFAWFPIEFWGSVVIAVGTIAVLASMFRLIPQIWGYMVLTGFSAGWSATYAAGVIFEDSPVSNLTGALNWGLLAFLWVAISGFVNPDKTVVVVIKDDGSNSR